MKDQFDAFDFVESYASEHIEQLVNEIKEIFNRRMDEVIVSGAQESESAREDYLAILTHVMAQATLRYSLQGSAAMLQAYRLHRGEEF
jgi:hypothetical protein